MAACAGCASSDPGVKLIDDDPDMMSINREAEIAYENGEGAKAEALYKSLIRRMPNDGETWFRLGNLYARGNRPEEAASAYQRALLANNTDARAWHNLGVIRLRQAWAAMLAAHDNVKEGAPLSGRIDDMLKQLEKLPLLEGERKP